jgi:hypothetical protein
MEGKQYSGIVVADAVPVTTSMGQAVPVVHASAGSATSTLIHAHVGTDGKTPTIFLPDGLEFHKPVQVQLPSGKVVSVQLPYGCRVGQAVTLHYSWTSMKYNAKIVQERSSINQPSEYAVTSQSPATMATAIPVSPENVKMAGDTKNSPLTAPAVDPKAQYKAESMQNTEHLYPSAPSSEEMSSSSDAKNPYSSGPNDGKYHSVYEKEGYKCADYKSIYETGELSSDGYKGAEYKSVYE